MSSLPIKISLAISPCPNDTFVFHGLLTGAVSVAGCELSITFADIHELNQLARRGDVSLCKVSSLEAIRLADRYQLCSVGAALGYGVGPLLVARPDAPPLDSATRVVCPGDTTTAFALFSHFYPECTQVEHVVFSDIMPSVARGDFDYGVVIHEGRFTYNSYGLRCEADLGTLWEERYHVPLPLGCLVVRSDLSEQTRLALEQGVRESLDFALADREGAFETMRRYAQELDPAAIWAHVDLYVNQWTLDLGESGQAAFDRLRAACGVIRS